MPIVRRIAVALTLAVPAAVPATATSQHASPGYSYRLTITGRTVEPNGRTTNYVVMSGRALVTEKAGRLDIDQASRGAVAGKDSYILYDSTSMTIVAPKARQVARLPLDALDSLERKLWASVPAARVDVAGVTNNVEQLGPGEPMLGMATTRYRTTQDYKVTTKLAPSTQNGTERIVQEFWIADANKGFVNPFSRLRHANLGPGGGYRQVMTRALDRPYMTGRGSVLRTVTTITSTFGKNDETQTVATMEITDLHAESVDDDILVAPTDYQVVEVGALASMTASSRAAQTRPPAKVSRPSATGDAAAEAKGGFVKTLHGMGRRP